MRIKFPQILCYEDWLDLFKMGFVGDDEFDENGLRRFKKKNDIPWAEDPETAEMKMVRDDIITTMEKNKAVMLELEQKMVKYQQLYTLENPSVYLATIKDSRNAEAPTNSLTAKTFWPMMNGRRKEIRIYIGKESEYPDHKKIHVRILAKQKMKETLLERYNNGELK
ncbi:MAG: hypothetical protein RL728_696 [Bacteroidota bacterium]|jgi:hypothetical protein